MPLGIALGIRICWLPYSPQWTDISLSRITRTVVAAINFDRTGDNKIGKYVLNHSFMMPGLVSTVVAIVLDLLFIQIF